MADPVRALALLWRASADPEGSWITSDDDIKVADLLHVRGLGHVEKRRPRPHQMSFFSSLQPDVEHDQQWLTYFVISQTGKTLWSAVLLLIERAMIAPEAR